MANKRPPLGQRQQEEGGGGGGIGRTAGSASVRKAVPEEVPNMGGSSKSLTSSRRGSDAEASTGGASKPPRGTSPASGIRQTAADRLAATLASSANMKRLSPSSRGMSPSSGISRGDTAGSGSARRGSLSRTTPLPSNEDDLISMRPGTGTTEAVASEPVNAGRGSRVTSANTSVRAKRHQAQLEEEEDTDGKSTPITEDMVLHAAAGLQLDKLTSINLAGQFISSIACIKSCPQLRNLDISHNRLRIIEGIDGLPQLRDLRLSYNRLWTMSGLSKNVLLEELHANMNHLEEIGKGWLGGHKKLKVLRLDGNRIRRMCNLEALVSLTHLDVGNNSLFKIEGLGMLAQMEVLCLSNNQISSLAGIDGAAWLREVDLSSNCITSLGELKASGKLEVLRLDHNQISDLGTMPRLGGLLELYLAHNSLERGRVVASKCPSLEFLSLAGNEIKELSEMRHFGGLTGLIDLKISGNPVCQRREFEGMCREHLSMLDTVDDIVIRERGPLVDDEGDATERALKGSGEGANSAPQRHKKELEDVLPVEFFDEQMREVREGIRRVREGVSSELLAVSKANDPAFAGGVGAAAAKAASASECKGAGQTTYLRGEAAVDAAMKRLHKKRHAGPSLKELMKREENKRLGIPEPEPSPKRELARSDYLMSAQLEGRTGQLKEVSGEGIAAQRKGGSEEVPDVIKRANAEIEKLLKQANAQIQDELEAQEQPQQEHESLESIMQRVAAHAPAPRPPDTPPSSPPRGGGRGNAIDWAKALADESRPGTGASAIGVPPAGGTPCQGRRKGGGAKSGSQSARGDRDAARDGGRNDGSQSARGDSRAAGEWTSSRPGTGRASEQQSRPGTGRAAEQQSRPGTGLGEGDALPRPGTAGGGAWDGVPVAGGWEETESRPGTAGSSRVRDRIIEAKQFSESCEFAAGDLAGGL